MNLNEKQSLCIATSLVICIAGAIEKEERPVNLDMLLTKNEDEEISITAEDFVDTLEDIFSKHPIIKDFFNKLNVFTDNIRTTILKDK